MKKLLASCILVAVGFSMALLITSDTKQTQAAAAKAKEPKVAHCVYFSLQDNSAEAKQKIVDACNEHLSGHDGTAFFAAGTRAEDAAGPVNDKDYDVALVMVFEDKASLDKYAKASRHLQFISENRAAFSKVRVFDAYVEAVK